MSSNSVGSYKARKINEINRQLVNEFHPAVTKVALAGQNLVRAYESVSKAFYLYTASLYGLSHSGKNAEEEAHEHAQELQRTSQILKKIYFEHLKWANYLANVVAIVSSTNDSEKERLKTLSNAYAKKEKQLVKSVDKGKQSHSELENFYEAQLSLSVDQQFQRYKFFAQCHSDLLKQHLDWSKFSVDVLEKEFLDGQNGREYEQNHLDELYQHAEEQQQIIAESGMAQTSLEQLLNNDGHSSSLDRRDCTLDSYFDKLKVAKHVDTNEMQNEDDTLANQELQDSSNGGLHLHDKGNSPRSLRKEFGQRSSHHRESWPESSSPIIHSHRHSSQTKSLASEASKHSSKLGRESNENYILKPIEQRDQTYEDQQQQLKGGGEDDDSQKSLSIRPPRKVLPPNIYKATPIVAMLQQQQQQANKRSSYVDRTNNVADASSSLGNRKSVNLPLGEQGSEGHDLTTIYQQFREVQQVQQQSSPVPYLPPQGREEKYEQEGVRALRSTQPPPTAQKPHIISMVSVTSSEASANIHIRDKSQEGQSATSRPSSADRMSQPVFSTSDYGRVVECVTGYSGQGDNQLSMDVGDRVILVKCGTRGWVLGRSEDSMRQGWFPAKFLKLL